MSEPTGSRGVQFVVGTSKTLFKTTSLVKKQTNKQQQQQQTKNIHNGYSDHAVISLHLCRKSKGVHTFDSIVKKGESTAKILKLQSTSQTIPPALWPDQKFDV